MRRCAGPVGRWLGRYRRLTPPLRVPRLSTSICGFQARQTRVLWRGPRMLSHFTKLLCVTLCLMMSSSYIAYSAPPPACALALSITIGDLCLLGLLCSLGCGFKHRLTRVLGLRENAQLCCLLLPLTVGPGPNSSGDSVVVSW